MIAETGEPRVKALAALMHQQAVEHENELEWIKRQLQKAAVASNQLVSTLYNSYYIYYTSTTAGASSR